MVTLRVAATETKPMVLNLEERWWPPGKEQKGYRGRRMVWTERRMRRRRVADTGSTPRVVAVEIGGGFSWKEEGMAGAEECDMLHLRRLLRNAPLEERSTCGGAAC